MLSYTVINQSINHYRCHLNDNTSNHLNCMLTRNDTFEFSMIKKGSTSTGNYRHEIQGCTA